MDRHTLAPILREAGSADDAVEVVFTGADHGIDGGEEQGYARALPIDEALRDDVLLVDEMNGSPLPPQHGAPLRLIVLGWYGMTSVKWLTGVSVVKQPFMGYHNVTSYRLRTDEQEPGTPVTRMLPRSLMVPPGFPVFIPRERHLHAGPETLQGRAWSGPGQIERVQVSVDGGTGWADATLGAPLGPHAWRAWTCDWDARPGEYELVSRATGDAGNSQTDEAPWNLGGFANNGVQRIRVSVRA